VLLVGAGGIGCELLKDLILLGYGEIHVVDLDTIDLSNLNRQFLFRQKDIKQPKASTAVNAVQSFNFFKTKLIPYQASIYETDLFPLSWFAQFDLIFNALDNIQARSYINKLALILNKTVMESGTTGTSGQSQPTFPNSTECYDCVHRETPKTFPVCTIRSTPSQPVHCIHWAKSFLFTSLFSEDEEEHVQPEGKDNAALGTDNENEIKNLIQENNELIELKKAIKEDDFAEKVIEKVFVKDIERLLSITDLWKARKEPNPLAYASVKGMVSEVTTEQLGTGQKEWSLEENIKVFLDATTALQKRMNTEKEIEFDKDDEDTLNFVVAAANIRSHIFSIPLKAKFDIKSIAGNIIPAIATTNAIIAGFSALLSLKQFYKTSQECIDESRSVFTTTNSDKFVSPSWLQTPNPKCAACSVIRGVIRLDGSKTIKDLVQELQKCYGFNEELSLSIGSNLLYDVDFDDNLEKTLEEMGIVSGVNLNIADESDELQTVELYVEGNSNGEIQLPDIKMQTKPKVEHPEEDENDSDDEIEMVGDDDDLIVVDESIFEKRKLSDGIENGIMKKAKVNEGVVKLD
jgi:ubiquitin-like 1-activating enzyme E1 B